ncbi:uncharacterized mitochondrial protein-like protein, partial [Tanacetum coccineum]
PEDSKEDAGVKPTKLDESEALDKDRKDDQDTGNADLNNLETTMNVSPIPTTRIDKDHLKNQIIRDFNSAIQTRKMTKISDEHAKICYINKIEAIRLFLAYASFMGFIVYQMDVKSAFLYGTIEEEFYVCQPPGFEDPQFSDKVYKVEKALYGLLEPASTPMEPNKALIKDGEADSVDVHLYRSMIGSLVYLTASRPDIMFVVCACARFQVTPKMLHIHVVKRIFRYLKGQPKLGLWYPRDSPFDLETFFDSDYARTSLDRKSTTGGCQFLGKRLISWQCKKQTIVANSTTEAEYVAAANCCGQKGEHKPRKAKRTTKISQSSGPIHLDAYKTVYKEWEDKMEKAATTTSSLDAEPVGSVNAVRLNLLLPVLVYAARHSLTAIRHKLMLLGITSYCWFLEEPKKVNGFLFEEIIDFLNASSVQYALTVNPTIYTNCIEQFWTYAKVKTVNEEQQIQALVDKKKVIIFETSIRSDLKLDDAEGTYCLPTATIFAELERMRTKKVKKVTLVDETQKMNDDNLMFDTGMLEEQEIEFEKVVEEPIVSVATTTKSIPVSATDPVTTVGEVVTTASTSVEIPNELTLAQTLIEIKTTKPSPITTVATIVTSVRPRAKGIIFHNLEEQVPASTKTFSSSQSQLP